MPRVGDWVEMELVVVVKAYPQPSTAHSEAVCVAAIRIDSPEPAWVRLYPVTFRDLEEQHRFKKWEVIRIRATKHSSDDRGESWRPDVGSIERVRELLPDNYWRERRAIVDALLGPTMCDLNGGRQGGGKGPSLAVVRPREILSFSAKEADPWSPQQLTQLSQGNLLGKEKTLLEKPGHDFYYRWTCEEPDCRGHRQSIVDWEIGQAYRKWGRTGDPVQAVRQKWGEEIAGPETDLLFFVGDQRKRPGYFMVLGAVWPRLAPDRDQLTLAVG